MAAADQSINATPRKVQPKAEDYPTDSLRFDLIMALLCGWFIIGLFTDGWAHNNGRVDDSFFTPWHAILYSGFGAVGAFLVFSQYRNIQRGYKWRRSLPRGYMLSLLAILIFGMAGGFDMFWHETFGFEANIEALLSPAHLLLATGALLFISGPLRAGWQRRSSPTSWRELLPVILSLTYMLSLLTFFLQYSHFTNEPEVLIYRPSSNRGVWEVAIISGILIPAALIMSTFLYALRRWRLPFGSFTLMLTVNTTLMFFMFYFATRHFPLILLVGPVGGLTADVLAHRLRPSIQNPTAARIFGFTVPFVMFLVYFILMNISGPLGIWWRIHMWLGVPFIAGIAGLFLSFLVMPPIIPAEPDLPSTG